MTRTEWSVILLIAALLVCVIALFSQSRRAAEDVVDRAFASAEILSGFFQLTQEHYTRNISNVSDVTFTTTPDTTPNALMYPATFGRLYTQSFNAAHPNTQFAIYSDYPFPSTQNRVLDDFARQALDVLTLGEEPSYRQVEPLDDGFKRVRLAVPIVMQDGCVSCHNDLQFEIAKHDWEVGDIRGVREVRITVQPPTLFSQNEIFLLLLLMSIASVLGIFIVFPSVRQEVQNRQYFHDLSVAAHEAAKTSLREAQTDALTQIGNRRYFDQVFVRAVLEEGPPMALLMFDLDHFKNINDVHGHDAGDYALQVFAKILQSKTRAQDMIARFGGEEFVVIIPNLGPKHVLAMAQRIHRVVEQTEFELNGTKFNLTVSGGCTNLQPEDTKESVLKRADDLLYEAKKSGRNRICSHFGQIASKPG